ncbi:MAG TPA: translocation/assembly module TamB domain-containing protein [Terriglobales bacterium]|nr:translocation/assembly module TamB domain-containing protein [Terriglobales bacterium]
MVAVVILLHSSKFHAYLLQTAQVKATQALGSQVQFRDYAFHWSGGGPNVELYNVVIHGAAPYLDPPLLQADSFRVQVTISSLWHRSWYVNDVRLERPVVRVFADNQGRTNLPKPSPSTEPSSKSNVDLFELGIRHLLLEHGEVYYNDQKSDLAADLHELAFQSSYGLLQKKYSGTLSYRDGDVKWQGANPLLHSLDAKFSATSTQFTLESAVLKTQSSNFSLQATAQNYSQPKVHATYQAVLNGSEFRHVLKNTSVPTGLIQLSGVLDYVNDPNKPFLMTTNLRGDLRSTELTVTQNAKTIQVRNIGAEYALDNGDARVTGMRAQLLGGEVAGTAAIRDLAGNTKSNLNVSLKNISIATIQDLLDPAAKQQALMKGAINANAEAAWGKTLDNLVAKADLNIGASMQPTRGGNATPVNGVIHARYEGSRQTVSLQQSYIKTPQTTISLDGTVSNHSALQVRLDSNELHEMEELANAFRAPGSAPLGLYGRANLTTTVSGSTSNPQIRGQVTSNELRVRGTTWKLLRAQITANPSSVRIDQGELLPASKGRITFQLGTDLKQWAFTDASQFQARLNASDLKAEDLAKAAGVQTQVSGTLSADVEAHGTQAAPIGQGKIQLAHASVANEPINAVNVGFQANGTTVKAQSNINLTAGFVNANLQYDPKQQSYTASVNTDGIKLDQLETVKARNLQMTGILKINATGQGTINDPGLQATIEVPQLNVRNQVISNLKFTTNVANHVAKFDLGSDVLNTHAGGHGTIQLVGDYPADIAFDTQVIPLQPIFAIYAPAQADNFSGQTEFHATLRGPLKNKSQLEAHLVVPQLALNYKNTIQLSEAAPIRADFTQGTLNVQRSAIRGTGTELTFQANIPTAKDAPIKMLLQGTVDLQLAQLFDPDVTSGGQLRFDIDSTGQRANPDIQGQVRIINASFAQAGTPLGLRDGNGVLTLTRDRLNVTQFKGQVGGGTVTAGGGVVYKPALRFDLGLKAEGVRVLYAQSIRTTVDSNLSLTGQYDNAMLQGQVNVQQLSFTSNFDLMDLASQFGGGEATPPPTGGFSENLRLEVGVQTPGGINLSSRTLSVAGSADLHVRGTASQPVMIGRINLNDGELIFSGNRYLVQGGTIDFRNPVRTEPVVDLAVNTTIQQYDIQMHFWGPVDHLHTNYSSDPSLPPADVINLIAFGKTSEASAANPAPPGSLGAQSLIASQVSGQVTNRIEKLAGISQLSVDPVLGSGEQSPGARIAVQQHVTSKLFVTFATDVTATQQQTIKVEYQINRKASVSAVRDQNGGFSFETSFRKEW